MSTLPPLWTKPDADGKPRFAQASDEALGVSQYEKRRHVYRRAAFRKAIARKAVAP